MKNKKILLTDFFDTLILRKISSDQLIQKWSYLISEFFDFKLTTDEIFSMRKAAEHSLSRLKYLAEDYEVRTEEIYQYMYGVIKNTNMINDFESLSNFLEVAKQTEIKLEVNYQIPNASVVKFILKQRQRGKTIICISDHGFGEEVLKYYLNEKGLDALIDKFYVSADYNKTKLRGSLYQELISRETVAPSNCLMIGDNKLVDVINAKKYGIDARKICQKRRQNPVKIYRRNLNHIFSKCDTYYLENYAFELYLFCHRIYEESIKNGIKQLIFFSREGQLLKRLFDSYLNIYGKKLKTDYLYISRSSAFIAALRPIEEEDFASLKSKGGNYSINLFLNNLGFDDERVKEICQKVDINKVIPNFFESEEFKNLISLRKFKLEYDAIRNNQAVCLKQYINEIVKEKNYAFVDVGWRGSMQDSLSGLLNKQSVIGLYYAIDSLQNMDQNNRKCGLMFSYLPYYPNLVQKAFEFRSFNLEYILKADHGRTLGYEVKDKRIVPIFADGIDKEIYDEFLYKFHNSIYIKFNKISQYFCDNFIDPELLQSFFAKLHLKMYKNCKLKEFRFLQSLANAGGHEFGNEISQFRKFKILDYIKFRVKNYLVNNLFKDK